MTQEHQNELILLSQKVYDQATDEITNYCAAKYCGVGNDTTEQQLEDYLFVAEGTSTYLLGNAFALLDPVSREAEIESFVKELRRVITTAEEKFRQGDKLN
jgi:hypothetical protein